MLQQKAAKALACAFIAITAIFTTAGHAVAQPFSASEIAAAYNEQLNNPLIRYIYRIDKTVRSKNLLTSTLTAQDLNKLPIGIVDPSGMVVICIDSAKFGPGGATFNAYAAITIPGQKTKVCLRATNIPFGPNGITSGGPGVQLTLVSTHVLPKKNIDLVLPGNGNNNVIFDCNGFKEANFEGYAVFKDYMFIPDPVEAPGERYVKAMVKLEHITNLNNMVASLSMTPFKLKDRGDFAFKVGEATWDMSDYNNPTGFVLPDEYMAEYGSNTNLWRGFYLRNVQVRIPFKKSGQEAKVGVNGMMIDDHGFTGHIYGNNLISINEGNMEGWVFSLDTLNIDLLRSRLKFGEASGGMRIPFLGSDSLGYRLAVQEWNGGWDYLLNVGLREDKIFPSPLGNAKIRLKRGSYVELHKPVNDKFVVAAMLHGVIMKDDGVARFNWLSFENVGLSTRAPYLHSGVFSLDGLDLTSPKLGGFAVSLNSVGFGLYNGQAVLKFGLGMNFSEEADRGFGVTGGFRLLAKVEKGAEPDAKQKWTFDGVKVDSIGINVETGAFDLNGLVQFFENDGVYGNGFRGALSMKLLKSSLNIQVSAGAYFGNKNGLKYWQVSAYAATDSWGVPIVPGVIYMNGFMGGLAYHMKKPDRFMVTPSMMDSTTYAPISSVEDWARQTYVPDANSGLSIMVGTSLYAIKKKLLSASVALEVGFNTSGGLNFVQFNGYATLFKDITTIAPSTIVKGQYGSEAAFTAMVNILYDRPNKTFHANVSAFMDLGVIRGAGAGNQLGELVIHADPSQWYVYVGRPGSPVGAKLQLAGVDFVTLQTYFMFGKLLDPFPAPPTEVSSVINYTPMPMADALRNGNGVAFGARFRSGAGFDWGWLYAGIWLGAGGDVMFSNSGNATCDGQAVGFGGWWARGQVYAWLQGGVGIRVRVFGQKREFKIVELAAAVLLEAKVPGYWTDALDENGNPTREDTSFTFKTAPPSDVLTMADLEYTYPLVDMKNFYKNEYAAGGGYLQVNSSVNFAQVFYPGTPGSGVTYDYKIKLKSITPGDTYQTNYQPITRTGGRINFNLPGLENGKVYRFSIVRIADDGITYGNGMSGSTTGGQTVNNQGFTGIDSTVAFSDTTVSNVINGQVSLKETEVLGYYFRVSRFNTFMEKINTMTAVAENQQDLAEGNVVLIATKNNIQQELFDEFEINDPYNRQGSYDDESMVLVGRQLGGGTEDNRLIHLVAETDNLWLEQDIYPLIYPRDINSTLGETYYRDFVAGTGVAGYSGIPPVKKITVEHSPKPTLPNTADPYERMTQPVSAPGATKMMLKYNLPFFACKDFMALYVRALSLWVNAPLPDKTVNFSRMVATGGIFPQIRPGSYMIKLSYHLPGSTSPTAVKVLPVIYQ